MSRESGDRSLGSLQRYTIIGGAICVVLFGAIAGWASNAELSGAIIANGNVAVETNLKKIQHPTGGVVDELNVREGDLVRAGDIVVRLDATVTRASLAIVLKSLDELEGRRARLEAERDGMTVVIYPDELVALAGKDEGVQKVIRGETILFAARRSGLAGQKAQLRERVLQLGQEITGLEAQEEAKAKQAVLIMEELKGVADLYANNLVPITRLTTLQREAASLQGERGQIVASIAQAHGKIAETELQIIQLDQDFRTEVVKELREIESSHGELIEKKVASEDQLKRIAIRSPQDGIVHQLAVHTVGGVVSPGEILMYVVPHSDALTIETKIQPQDIDQIHVGQAAVVRLSAFNQQTTPELNGTVVRVAAELTHDATANSSWYSVRIELPDEELARLKGLMLVPGMPIEAHIQTGKRTALSYFMKPLSDQITRAFREE